jgi:hypothetical protein
MGRLSVSSDAEPSGLTVWSTALAKGFVITFWLFTLIIGFRARLWGCAMLGVRSSKTIGIAGDMGRLSVSSDAEFSGLTVWRISMAKGFEIVFWRFTLIPGSSSGFFLWK